MRILLTGVFVDNPLEAHRFYTEVLGFVSKMYLPEAQIAIVASAEDPDGTSLLLEPNGNPIAKTYQEGIYNSGLPVIIFGVKDIYKEYESLKDKGVKFKGEPETTDWGIQVMFEDGFGNIIQISQI